jgi:hypothetical protein
MQHSSMIGVSFFRLVIFPAVIAVFNDAGQRPNSTYCFKAALAKILPLTLSSLVRAVAQNFSYGVTDLALTFLSHAILLEGYTLDKSINRSWSLLFSAFFSSSLYFLFLSVIATLALESRWDTAFSLSQTWC